jgi:uncharacterized surface protein with fasciclin (FAS1) repeats
MVQYILSTLVFSKQQAGKVIQTLLVCMALVSCTRENLSGPQDQDKQGQGYYLRQKFVIQNNASFAEFGKEMQMYNVLDTLANPGPFTTFILSGQPIYFEQTSWLDPVSEVTFAFKYYIGKVAHNYSSMAIGANLSIPMLTGTHAYLSKYLIGKDTLCTINGVTVAEHDYYTSNGFIQTISSPLPLERYASLTDLISSKIEISYFNIALKRTGLDKLLSSVESPYTVFAPVDDAFINSGDPAINTLDSILSTDTARLGRIVRSHIIKGRYFLSDFQVKNNGRDNIPYADTTNYATLQGKPIGILLNDNTFINVQFFDANRVVTAKIQTMWGTPSPSYFNVPTPTGNLQMIDQLLYPE